MENEELENKKPEDYDKIREAIDKKLEEIKPVNVEQQLASPKFTSEQYSTDLDNLFNLYKSLDPQFKTIDEVAEFKSEFKPLTDLITPCEQMLRTNALNFTNGLKHILSNGTAKFSSNSMTLKEGNRSIKEIGIINFMDVYSDEYFKVISKGYELSNPDKPIDLHLSISMFITAYCKALIDCILMLHESDTLSGLTVVNEASQLQLRIIYTIFKVRELELDSESVSLRWGIKLKEDKQFKI